MHDGTNFFGEVWTWLKSEAGMIAVSGAAGGAVRAFVLKERPALALRSIAVGFLCAIFLESSVAPYLPMKFSHFGIGFLIGIAGIAIVGFVMDVVRAYRNRIKEGQP